MMRLSLWILFLVPTLGIAAEHSYGGKVLAADIASIHKVAVYSSVGKTLYVRRVGLTAFNNHSEEVAIQDWSLDSRLVERVSQALGARFAVEPLDLPPGAYPRDNPDSLDYHEFYPSVVKQGRQQGVDAVLLITRAMTMDTLHIPIGLCLCAEGLFGRDRIYVGTPMMLVFFRLNTDAKPIVRNLYQGITVKRPWPIKTTWAALDAEQQRDWTELLQSTLYGGVDEALTGLGLVSSPVH